jgi:hypothetical protein
MKRFKERTKLAQALKWAAPATFFRKNAIGGAGLGEKGSA